MRSRRLEPERRRKRTELYSTFVRAGDLVFDVGANVGNRSLAFLDLGARVVAFEPQSRCRQALARIEGREGFTLDTRALSDREGVAVLRIPSGPRFLGRHTLASMSDGWIEAVRRSGRFADFGWSRSEQVKTTTLDAAIERYGEPAFTKIDVEGHEETVLSGLSRPLPALSMEFAPENAPSIRRSILRLAEQGDYEWNYSTGESSTLSFETWCSSAELIEHLAGVPTRDFGDVYARTQAY